MFSLIIIKQTVCCVVSACGAGCQVLYLEQSLGLSDHVGQALGGSQVLTQVPLVRAAQAVLPMTRPAAKRSRSLYCLELKAAIKRPEIHVC